MIPPSYQDTINIIGSEYYNQNINQYGSQNINQYGSQNINQYGSQNINQDILNRIVNQNIIGDDEIPYNKYKVKLLYFLIVFILLILLDISSSYIIDSTACNAIAIRQWLTYTGILIVFLDTFLIVLYTGTETFYLYLTILILVIHSIIISTGLVFMISEDIVCYSMDFILIFLSYWIKNILGIILILCVIFTGLKLIT
jgi:hypothetical protein